jgi:large subunit ribosomal protein L11
MVLKTPPASELIKKGQKFQKGSSRPQDIVGRITWRDVEDIAKIKMPDLNAHRLEQAKKTIAGSARSMGVEVID